MKQDTTFKQHSLWVTMLIIGMSILVLLTIGISYLQYNTKMNDALKNRTKEALAESTAIAANTIILETTSIAGRLHTLVLPYEYGLSGHGLDGLFQVMEKESGQNNLGSLSYHSAEELSALLRDPALPDISKDNIRNLLSNQDVVFGHTLDNYTVSITIPVYKNEAVDGALSCTYHISDVAYIFKQETFEGNGQAYVIKKDGSTLIPVTGYDYDPAADPLTEENFFRGYSLEKLRSDLLNSRSGITHYTLNGEAFYAYYQPLGFDDLFLFNVIPTSFVDKDSMLFSNLANSLITTIIIIFLALISFILAIQTFNNVKFKRNQEHLLLEKERYDTILNHSNGTIWEYNIESDTLIKSDPDVGIHSGLSVLPEFNKLLLDNQLIYPEDIPLFNSFYHDMKNDVPEIYAELRAKDITGSFVWFSLTGSKVFDKSGVPVSVIGQTLNIDHQKREMEELRDHSRRDSLTHLYNRSAIEELIKEVLLAPERIAMHAFFMIDIDNFKGINDSYGHIFGDAVLIELSARLTKAFKGRNILGRLGGDEFAIFLYDIPSISYIKDKAEKIARIFQEIYIGDDTQQSISGSIGISLYPADGITFEELLRKADIALYHSKGIGKNCYSVYAPDIMSGNDHLSYKRDEHNETSYQHEDHSLVDSSIVANTVDILFDARKLDISINMILSLIGNYYELGSIVIFEQNTEHTAMDITYEWASTYARGSAALFSHIPIETAEIYSFYKTTANGVFYHNDVSCISMQNTPISDALRNLHIKCMFQCGIFNQGSYHGCICVQIFDPERSWTKPEIDSLTLLSKILGAHILKLRTEESAKRIVERDPLTNAYNFFQFIEEAGRIVSAHPAQSYACAYIDINKFKFINETYGYGEGDRVLIEFAAILRNYTDEGETFGRVSGDKFVALFKFKDRTTFLRRLKQINRELNSIRKTDSDTYKLSIIFGLYIIDDSTNMTVNIDRANIARKSITDRHKTTFAFFDETMKSRILKQKEIEDIMEEALKNEEFLIYYQPKFDLATNKICGAEALVRWNRPGTGIISPGDFIPIFEENGFIVDIDYYVFERVCRKIRGMLDEEKHIVPISVNFSRIHLKDRSIVSYLKSMVRDYDIPASLIEIEITESALVDDNGFIITLLNEIHNNGFRLSMDDFGSGLSSLNMLRTFPFDVLKIDKEFFQHGSTTERERVVIANIVKMASELHMDIVSEGVETMEQADFLRDIQCPIAQGFLFEKPIPEDEFEQKYCETD